MSASHLELWGLPGAGKSTITKALRAEGYNAPGLYTLKRCIVVQPGTVTKTMRRLMSVLGRDAALLLRDRRARVLTRLAIRQACTLADQGARPTLLEEGVTQELWRLLYFDPELVEKRWWKAFLNATGPTIAVLQVSPERAYRGILSKRKHGPVNASLKNAALEDDRWVNAGSAFETVLAAITASGQRSIIFQIEGLTEGESTTLVRDALKSI